MGDAFPMVAGGALEALDHEDSIATFLAEIAVVDGAPESLNFFRIGALYVLIFVNAIYVVIFEASSNCAFYYFL